MDFEQMWFKVSISGLENGVTRVARLLQKKPCASVTVNLIIFILQIMGQFYSCRCVRLISKSLQ